MSKKLLRGIILSFLALALIICGFSLFVLLGKDSTLKLEIGDVNLDKVSDGTYTGSYSGYRWSNEIEITVKNHVITDINVIKSQVFAKDEVIDSLIDAVISKQTLDVDTVSGATADSKAFLSAVEDAFK
jgi:uncharacterized protein with FMN-binding domain